MDKRTRYKIDRIRGLLNDILDNEESRLEYYTQTQKQKDIIEDLEDVIIALQRITG